MKFSSLPRIYANIKLIESCLLTLPADNIHYLLAVLRLKTGDHFRIFNNRDGEFIAQIISNSKNNLVVEVNNLFRNFTSEPAVNLAMAIIKNDRMLSAISMAVQLGATMITPLVTDRSQRYNINSQKLVRCIVEYTQQSERLVPAHLESTVSLSLFLDKNYNQFILYANEEEDENNTLLKVVGNYASNLANISVIVGPEGGFSVSELKMLSSKANCHSISLGSTVLRSETAVASCLAQIKLLR